MNVTKIILLALLSMISTASMALPITIQFHGQLTMEQSVLDPSLSPVTFDTHSGSPELVTIGTITSTVVDYNVHEAMFQIWTYTATIGAVSVDGFMSLRHSYENNIDQTGLYNNLGLVDSTGSRTYLDIGSYGLLEVSNPYGFAACPSCLPGDEVTGDVEALFTFTPYGVDEPSVAILLASGLMVFGVARRNNRT